MMSIGDGYKLWIWMMGICDVYEYWLMDICRMVSGVAHKVVH